ncbi:hypothetical protein JCM18918_1704 [Cutibacterium acnes JCM 18918]|nr:hypothetical protein JCM18918_1704 [Cutibacterium acnes JCM 18918]
MAEATDFNENRAAHIMECPGYSTVYRSGVATSVTGRPRVDVEEVVLLGSLAGQSSGTSPRSTSIWRARTVMDGPSMWKNRRAAARVSENPNPSAPKEA